MLTFLRRIRRSLLSENKFSKYLLYAIGEILLVVIGILLALQINNWNEGRKDENREQVILKSLRANLVDNLELLEASNQSTIDAYEASVELHKLIMPNSRSFLTQEVDSLLSIMFDYFAFDPASGAMDEVISSGQLNIIRSSELKNEISNWSRMLKDTQTDIDIANKYLFEEMIVYLSKYGNISSIPIDARLRGRTEMQPRPKSSFDFDYQTIMSSPEFENMVSWHAVNLVYIVNEYVTFQAYLKDMLKLMDVEIVDEE